MVTTWWSSAVASPGEMMTYGTRMKAAATRNVARTPRSSDPATLTIRRRRLLGGRRSPAGTAGGVITASPFLSRMFDTGDVDEPQPAIPPSESTAHPADIYDRLVDGIRRIRART